MCVFYSCRRRCCSLVHLFVFSYCLPWLCVSMPVLSVSFFSECVLFGSSHCFVGTHYRRHTEHTHSHKLHEHWTEHNKNVIFALLLWYYCSIGIIFARFCTSKQTYITLNMHASLHTQEQKQKQKTVAFRIEIFCVRKTNCRWELPIHQQRNERCANYYTKIFGIFFRCFCFVFVKKKKTKYVSVRGRPTPC